MTYKHLKDKHGFQVSGWMVREYSLSGNELMAFALVFSLSQGHAGRYTGGIPFMSEFFGWAGNTCRKHLRTLVKKGLLIEYRGDVDGVPFCYYSVPDSIMENHPSKIEEYPSKFEVSTLQKLNTPTLQDLKVNNNISPNVNIKGVRPTIEEVAEYAKEQGFADPVGFADYYIRFQTENGWMTGKGKNRKPIDNWRLNVIAWSRYRKGEIFSQQPQTQAQVQTRTMGRDEFNAIFQ